MVMDPAFQKKFLRDFKRGSREVKLALFGKHPAWDDHMDDLGLATASLRLCKRLLYIEGIAANAARQQSLPQEQAAGLFPYRHVLLWICNGEMILLRLIESEDGRGRGFFPLVAAVHLATDNPEASLAALLVPLRTFVDNCRSFELRDEVRDLHRQTQADLQSAIPHARNGNPVQEMPTREETDSLRAATTGRSFLRARIPVTRYDPAKSFAALIAIGQDQPALLVKGDVDAEIHICLGQPDRGDFWFLRRKTDVAS